MELLQYLVGTIGFLAGLALSTQTIFALIQLYFAKKAGIDLVDFLQNRGIRRKLDDELKLLIHRIGRSIGDSTFTEWRNKRILRIAYTYSFRQFLLGGWQGWGGNIWSEVEIGKLRLERTIVLNIPAEFKKEALLLLLARRVLLKRPYETEPL